MKEELLQQLENPQAWEKLYRSQKGTFTKTFKELYPEIQSFPIAQFWHARLNYESERSISWGDSSELLFVGIATLLAAFIAKFPPLFDIDNDFFYTRNVGFIVFPILILYFSWKRQLSLKRSLIVAGIALLTLVYINLFPREEDSDTLILACIHVPLLLWSLMGSAYIGKNLHDTEQRLNYLRFNGDWVIMSTLILVAGMLLTGITFGLFNLIEMNVEQFYFNYVVVWGLAATPIVATYVIQSNPQLVSRVSPVIAKIFSPLVLLTLVVYLAAIIWQGKNPYTDRDFLILFNFLLIGVMALIFFSVVETSKETRNKSETLILFSLSLVTVGVNLVALSAIIYRTFTGGITPNRLAVMGGNLLMLINLMVICLAFYRGLRNADSLDQVEHSIARFLPFYSGWVGVVVFVLPLVFGFK